MNRQQKQKLIIVYLAAGIFIFSCLWSNDPFLGLLSAGFMLGFMTNETFFMGSSER
jgi:hypothetical protein